jgi:hypothetical protein
MLVNHAGTTRIRKNAGVAAPQAYSGGLGLMHDHGEVFA